MQTHFSKGSQLQDFLSLSENNEMIKIIMYKQYGHIETEPP